MNKSLLAIIVTGSLMLAGCSSSGGSGGTNDGDSVVDRPQPVDPEFGLPVPSIPDIDNTPEWGLDMGNAPERPIPADPDWGLDMGNAPDRLPPMWGGPEVPEIDNGPEASYTISGNTITDANGNSFLITDVNWHGQSMMVQDKDGNEYYVNIIRQGEYEGDFGIVVDGEAIIIGGDAVQGGPRPMMESSDRAIDHSSIRDSIRSRLK